MKKFVLLTFILTFYLQTFAQVGINTDNSAPDPSAMLDVKSPAKGLLPPRVALTATNVAGPVSSPAIGLQVYNTATAGTSPYNVRPGIYCWDGTQWIPVIAPKGANIGDMQYWNGTQWITVPVGSPGQFLQLSPSNIPMWAGGTFATIITTPATSITASAATSGGTISSDGGSAITVRGICYNTAPNPTTANYKITSGSGTGTYSITITGLTANTVWYARAYAINGAGTVYGNEITFTTLSDAVVPSLVTTVIGTINPTTAASGGYINNSGGATVTSRGVCWNTSPNPTIANSKTSNGTGTGGFISSLTGLLPNTLYYVRAYATNSAGTGYGNELSFTTLCASPVAVSVSITTSANQVCAGSSVTFTATPTNGGSAPVYQWKINGAIVGANVPTYSFTPLNNDVITCILTSNLACVTGNPVSSNAITMTVNPSGSAGVTIAASANPVCAGASVTYTATPVNGGTAPAYIWKVNGNTVSGATTSTYSYVPVHNDAVVCQMTSNAPCVVGNPAMSNIINMIVNPIPTVSISIEASSNPVCDGSIVSLQATPTNGGINPSYQWKVNGINVGTNNSVLMYTPSNNDSVRCIMTSSLPCATNTVNSNSIIITVNPMQSVGVSIAASANNVCTGTTVNFTATVTNAGTISNYQWKKGGVVISGATNVTYSYVPVNNDVITCVFTSNPPCTFSNTATSNAITMTVNTIPLTPTSGIHTPTAVQIIWNWNSVSGSSGYKWNSVNEYGTAIDMGSATSKTETGLACDSAFTRYVWAYNSCGYSTSVSLTQATSTCLPGCGTLTINHLVGAVAPVSKTTTYGTVTGIPGEEEKCWITSNLGSDHQAMAVDDATEASAGWYWQFNRKQGYKHDGTTRTPNTTWITSINENSDWQTANDPCNLELGNSWRIPTYTEWNNVENTGGWTNWEGPWASGLKLHAAGGLFSVDGSLGTRGANGAYRSSNQNDIGSMWFLFFNIEASELGIANKAAGHSIRCLKDCAIAPSSPSIGTHTPTQTQIIWNWDTVTGATGYKWSITNDYATATDMGMTITKTEMGLICDSSYTRWVWAYNICDISTSTTLTTSTTPCIPTNCLVAWYPFNGNANDESGHGNNGIVNGATLTTDRFGNSNQAYNFDGNDWIEVLHNATINFNLTDNYSISLWLKEDITLNEGDALSKWNSGFSPYPYFIRCGGLQNSNPWFASGRYIGGVPQDSTTCQLASSNFSISSNVFYHIASTFTIDTIKLYVNDALVAVGLKYMIPGNVANNNNLYIGRRGTPSTNRFFKGIVDDIRIFNCALSPSEITALYNEGAVPPTVTTASVTNITQNSATSGGNVTSSGGTNITARGVCYGTSPNPTISGGHTTDGSGTGTFTSAISGLTSNTTYYLRAYAMNSVGTAYGIEMMLTTMTSSICGSSITINHSAGIVAPVTKSVTYGTVTNIQGEPTKCWITSNLGSDHQAIAVDDATEASAGWYWQFNRKQGYMHDGTNRTPNTTWITSISENSDWITSNDPCTIELGSGWRIPTSAEWTNVDASGNWTNWNGLYSSALKLHAAGNLHVSVGALNGRGSVGDYWSSTQGDALGGWTLYFTGGSSHMSNFSKSYGFSMRCLRD